MAIKNPLTGGDLRLFAREFFRDRRITIRTAADRADISHVALYLALKMKGTAGISTIVKVLEANGVPIKTQYRVGRLPAKRRPRPSIYGFGK